MDLLLEWNPYYTESNASKWRSTADLVDLNGMGFGALLHTGRLILA